MYKINWGLKEWHIDNNLFLKEYINKCKIFNINNPRNVKFFSQQDEDKYIIQYLLKEKIDDGTYLEIGACDGVLYSNTKTLEEYFGFKGILIEPQKHFYNNLIENRSSKNNEFYNCAVTNSDVKEISFIGNNAEAGVVESINTNINKYGWKSYKVENKKMKDILENSKFKYIDFMIIDVEGSELLLLKSIDFSFPIFCIIIEAHSTEQEKIKYLENIWKKMVLLLKKDKEVMRFG